MFVAADDYKKSLINLISEERNIDLAIAFWGEGAQKLIPHNLDYNVRVICNLRTGGTNPAVIRDLMSNVKSGNGSLQIRHSSRLHAKVVVGRRQALIGSANLSTNGLGLEDETLAHWMEAGIHTWELKEVDSAREWFEAFWESDAVNEIEDGDLDAAQIAWDRRQSVRPPLGGDPMSPFSMGKFTVDELRGRPAYVTIYRKWLSTEASAAKDAEKRSAMSAVKDAGKIDWWAYECWDGLPSAPAELLGIYWGTRGKLLVEGVCTLVDCESVPFTYENGEEGWIELAAPQQRFLDRPFSTEDAASLTEEISEFIEVLWFSAKKIEQGEHACVIHLAEMVRIWNEWKANQ
ncbi:hypothetical protein DMX02_04680 [Pseudomonas jessenii]|nr:hypothetical protein DMX02_04680 [Pseudomonas jessenii]